MILVIRFWLTQAPQVSKGVAAIRLRSTTGDSQHAHPTKALVFFWQSRGEETDPVLVVVSTNPSEKYLLNLMISPGISTHLKIYMSQNLMIFPREVGVNIKNIFKPQPRSMVQNNMSSDRQKWKHRNMGIVLEGSLLVFRLRFYRVLIK